MKGDALLQKTYNIDFLTKKNVKKQGQVPQYYIKENHEAIIDPELFDLVQAEMADRRRKYGRYMGVSIFSGKIRCGDTKQRYEGITAQIEQLKAKKCQMKSYLQDFSRQEGVISTFDENLWASLVDCLTVGKKGEAIEVTFRDGTTIKVE